MKLTTKALSIALIATVANALTLSITDSDKNESLNGMGLSSVHEGAGINYFLLGTTPEQLIYEDGKIHAEGTLPLFFNSESNIIQLSVSDSPTVSIVDGKIDLGQQLYACKNINDPYRYSEQSFFVTVGELGSECYPVSIKVNDLEETQQESASTSATAPLSVDVPVAYTLQLADSWAYGSIDETSTAVAAAATEVTAPSVSQVSSAAAATNIIGSTVAGIAAMVMLFL